MAQTLLRDAFTHEVVLYIKERVSDAWPKFDALEFERVTMDRFSELNFGARSKRITDTLAHLLPKEFSRSADILTRSLGAEPEADDLTGFEGFYIMPLAGYISKCGIDYPDVALPVLYEMTKRFTAENDIRPFIRKYPDQTMQFLKDLTRDPNPHARRLASEGTRPRLPLASRIPEFQQDPGPVVKLLDRLYKDENLMVRRSVANNINDISKDNPDFAVETLERWRRESPSKELDWMIRHALRTLIKRDHPGALSLLGFHGRDITIDRPGLDSKSVVLGSDLRIEWQIVSGSDEPQIVALNYIIHFKKANGKNRPKVFRLSAAKLEPEETRSFEKVHRFLPFINQSFYSGTHYIEIRGNGVSSGLVEFELLVP